MVSTCPNCLSGPTEDFHHLPSIPVNSCLLLETEEEARAFPTADLVLAFCRQCGFIYNRVFEPERTEYSGRYEETQGFSPTFRAFHVSLADRLIDSHALKGKTVVEIGCGKGEFLILMNERGGCFGLGFDPSFVPDRVDERDGVRFVADYYSEANAGHPCDLLCCKMTLEHIATPRDFLRMIRRSLGNQNCAVFFMVPEAERIFGRCAFEDIYYEHCSYFTEVSLRQLFRSTGFDVLSVRREYGEQYLSIEARPGQLDADTDVDASHVDALAETVGRFPEAWRAHKTNWERRFRYLAESGQRVAIWGSGSKAVAFLTSLETAGTVQQVVDISPHRQGHFLPVTGHRIVGPTDLVAQPPDLVIAMNAIYLDEIRGSLDAMGLRPELEAL